MNSITKDQFWSPDGEKIARPNSSTVGLIGINNKSEAYNIVVGDGEILYQAGMILQLLTGSIIKSQYHCAVLPQEAGGF